jgi:radical SAM superfamily enzyme YgiQ (UPF0313 family)
VKYNGTVYRPPIEAQSFLLPITEGCTHNTCAFCNMYQGIPFRMLPLEEVEEYLVEPLMTWGATRENAERAYFVGADPFALSAENLLCRIELAKRYLPKATTFTMYARTDNIARKSDDDLRALKAAGVDDLYIGVESALDDVLSYLEKGYTSVQTLEQCKRLNEVGIRHCDLLMLGAAGKGRGIESARAAAKLENAAMPHKILMTTMTAYMGTKLNDDIASGAFVPAGETENLQEERELIACLDLPGREFWAAHPLDAVSLAGVLGPDTQEMLDDLDYAIEVIDETAINRANRRGSM